MKKMGRPTLNPKPKIINFRMDNETYETLEKYAIQHDTTISEVIRESIDKFMKENRKK